ncbi:MAG TPA: pyridoxamine 5'-phosphate oxidase family protein [Spirochaetia bacterium]|nr:pyridoxamine 5'-phosphate oxidase family protein [Spirochaetia bacterium]
MFAGMRRRDREMDRPETDELLLKGKYGILSMNGENDYAYGVPMSYVYTGKSIYLHCALEGKKLVHLRNDNKVTFCVVAEADPLPNEFSMKYRSAIVFGHVSEVDDDGEKRTALVALVEKYATSEEYVAKGRIYATDALHKTVVLRIDIEHISGKARR